MIERLRSAVQRAKPWQTPVERMTRLLADGEQQLTDARSTLRMADGVASRAGMDRDTVVAVREAEAAIELLQPEVARLQVALRDAERASWLLDVQRFVASTRGKLDAKRPQSAVAVRDHLNTTDELRRNGTRIYGGNVSVEGNGTNAATAGPQSAMEEAMLSLSLLQDELRITHSLRVLAESEPEAQKFLARSREAMARESVSDELIEEAVHRTRAMRELTAQVITSSNAHPGNTQLAEGAHRFRSLTADVSRIQFALKDTHVSQVLSSLQDRFTQLSSGADTAIANGEVPDRMVQDAGRLASDAREVASFAVVASHSSPVAMGVVAREAASRDLVRNAERLHLRLRSAYHAHAGRVDTAVPAPVLNTPPADLARAKEYRRQVDRLLGS